MITSTYTVVGMACGHCVNAVSAEMAKLAGVSTVEVDLGTSAVTVTSTEPLAAADVAPRSTRPATRLLPAGQAHHDDHCR